MLYDEALNMGLTHIGSGLPSPGPILNYQIQETHINKGEVKEAEKDLKENNTRLTNILEDTALIRDSRKPPFEFASQNAQELHAFLIEHDIPKPVADKVVIDRGIDNIEALQVALNDGTIGSIQGVGDVKVAKLQKVVDMHPQSVANVLAIPENDSGPSKTV